MSINKVMELVFSLIMLLFLAIVVLGVLVGITLVQQLAAYEISFGMRCFFIGGMFATFLYIMKLIVDKIREYHRYI
ncbi:hypothetical protein C0580_02610 [Candidatus Parcubacteria bacterium]|nr:MAG: hypothetical protein C0580_02610 [Candidatus Parcubacteria bacterium]